MVTVPTSRPVPVPTGILDRATLTALQNLTAYAGATDLTTAQVSQQVSALGTTVSPAQLQAIQAALSAGGSNPLPVTGLVGSAGPACLVGPHAQRISTHPKLGSFFYESDRFALYVGSNQVQYTTGVVLWSLVVNLPLINFIPPDLDFDTYQDQGFLYWDPGFDRLYLWTDQWQDYAGQFPRLGVLLMATNASPPAGWHVADGSTVSISTSIPGLPSTVTLPDLVTGTPFFQGASATGSGTQAVGTGATINRAALVPWVRL